MLIMLDDYFVVINFVRRTRFYLNDVSKLPPGTSVMSPYHVALRRPSRLEPGGIHKISIET